MEEPIYVLKYLKSVNSFSQQAFFKYIHVLERSDSVKQMIKALSKLSLSVIFHSLCSMTGTFRKAAAAAL